MPEQTQASLLNLSGRNGGVPPSHIGDNEFAEMLNYYQIAARLKRRKGCSKVTTTEAVEDLTSLFAYKKEAGAWELIVGGLTGLYRQAGVGLAAITRSDGGGAPYVSSQDPWVHSQYKDVLYHSRRGTGTLKRGDQSVIFDAGITAPSGAPTLADGGAGALAAGDYYGVVTFYNSLTGAESNPSPTSAVLTLGANRQIAWTNIAVSTNPQVNSRRIYRTLPNQQGVYFLVAQIGNNTATTYTDNITDAALGDEASSRNGLPPNNVAFHAIWKERLWSTDEIDIFFSEVGKPESFFSASVIAVYPDDGHKVRALHAYGERLVVGKTNGIHFITGTSEANFALATLTNRHGCYSHHSMKNAEGLLFWFGGDHFYVSDGVTVETISDPKVKDIVDAIPDTMKEFVVAGIEPALGWYIAAVASEGSTVNDLLLVYNYRDKTWATFQYTDLGAPRFIGDFYDTNFGLLVYALFYNRFVYELNDTNLDDGEFIEASLDGKAFGFNSDAMLKAIAHPSILIRPPSVVGNMTLSLLLNMSDTVHKSKTIALGADRKPWKRVNLSNTDQAATLVQLRVEYAAEPEIEIAGFAFELVQYGGRSQGL